MQLTIDLDDDLYALARAQAAATKTSLSKAVADLLLLRVAGELQPTPPAGKAPSGVHPLSGFGGGRKNAHRSGNPPGDGRRPRPPDANHGTLR